MLFNSNVFVFCFLPITVVGYWMVQNYLGPTWSTATLAAASYAFYLWNEPKYPFLLFTSISLNFFIGLMISHTEGHNRTIITTLGIALNLMILAYYKYFCFFFEVAVSVGIVNGHQFEIPLPAGISFYTFTQIAFLVDCYARKVEGYNPTSYFLFVSLFPHIIAGPILHHKEMVRQFEVKKTLSIARYILPGLAIFSMGLAKKTILADSVSPAATAIFSGVQAGIVPGLIEAWVGALAYTSQIYFDFSGYSDMAIGISLLLGIRLPINFNSPYKACSIIDFWRRWHITLSRFLRDYLYIALGGNRRGNIVRYVNLLVTMALGGLWHGAAWTFVIWGAAHGLALAVAHTWSNVARRYRGMNFHPFLSAVATFLLVVFLWVPFRADSFETMLSLWRGMLGLNGLGLPDLKILDALASRLPFQLVHVAFGLKDIFFVSLCFALAWFFPNSQQLMARYRPGLDTEGYNALPGPSHNSPRLRLVAVIVFGLLFATAISMISPNSEFIYFRF